MNPAVFVTPGRHGRIDTDWLARARARIGGDWYARTDLAKRAGLTPLDLDSDDPAAIQQAFTDQLGADRWLLVVRAGLELPDDFTARIACALDSPDCPDILLPTGNHAPAVDPLAGLEATANDPDHVDSLIAACGHQLFIALDHIVTGCVVVTPRAPIGPESRIALLDTVYVHDPEASPTEPDPRVSLGHLRLGVQRLLHEGIRALPPIGRDGRPVTLHISHNWGGGVSRWIEDFITGDDDGHHLVLAAGSDFRHHRYGQWLRLYALGPERACIRQWRLSPVIADTCARHAQYHDILDHIVHRYGIGRVIVSSLIGHSLDALRSGVPTLEVLHDYYPAWPLLEHDPLSFADGAQRVDLEGALEAHGDHMRFAATDAGYWRALTRDWLAAVEQHDVRLAAPGDNVAQRWRQLLGAGTPAIELIPHGFPGWPEPAPAISPKHRTDGRLRLVVVGRMQEGKGLSLLARALPQLRRHAQITLIGSGHGGKDLFGLAGVNVIYQYRRDELPALLAEIGPHAALFLSTVAETWNYTLSELRSLGVVPIATRLGSFGERIRHQLDGLLIEPAPDSLVDTVARLHAEPQRLQTLRDALPQEHELADMVAAYNRLRPPEPNRPAPPAYSGDAALQQAALAGELAERQQASRLLARERETLAADLEQRTRWAETMERQFRARSRWAEQLEARNKTLDERILEGERERQALYQQAAKLEERLGAAMGRLEALTVERDLIFNSRSWRLTRPLRVTTRVLRNAREARIWHPRRWPGLLKKLRFDLRTAGLRHTLWLWQSPEAPAPQKTTRVKVPAPAPDAPLKPVHFAPPTAPEVSIVIPVYNQAHFTRACLASLAKAACRRGFEVIVVDDCSGDRTPALLASCRGITAVRNPENRGFIHSCNEGARRARGEYLVFLNNDTTVDDDWLDALLDTFEQFPRTGVAGAKLVYPDGTLQEAGGIVFDDASGWNYGRGDQPDKPEYNFACAADYVSGACLAIRRELFDTLGGFDTHFAPAYYEDTDLCFRVREAGYEVVYQPLCRVIHHEGATSGTDESTGAKRYQVVNRDKFLARWRETLRRQPAPITDPGDLEQVRHARHFRSSGRILFIDATTPQPDHDSGSVRMSAMLEICRELGFQVTFMPQNLAWVGNYSRRLQRAGIEVITWPWTESIEHWLGYHGQSLHTVVVSRYYVLKPILRAIRKHCPRTRLVFDTVDLHFLREQREAHITGSAQLAKQAARTRDQELALIRACDRTLVVSPVEKELLAEQAPRARIEIVSNIHQVHGRRRGWAERKDLLFVGGFRHTPNIDAALWLADDIFPRVREALPDVRLHLIGSHMPAEITELDRPGIVVHGFVEDLAPYLDGCRLSLAPLRYGAGVKGKVNQAMSHGLPVVATGCAAEGMFLRHGEDVLVAEDAEDFAAQVVRAYRDQALWQRLSDGGLANVEKYFSRNAARTALQEILGHR